MKKLFLPLVAATSLLATPLAAAELNVGFVDFKKCVEQSKQGQQEKVAFEALKKTMTETLEKTDQELAGLAKKLEDQDYMDGLSPTAEQELKARFQGLSQELARYQNQYYQLLNQANYKMIQTMHEQVSRAAEKVRKSEDLSLILNEESTFASSVELDYTAAVVSEMDRRYELENSESAVAAQEPTKMKKKGKRG